VVIFFCAYLVFPSFINLASWEGQETTLLPTQLPHAYDLTFSGPLRQTQRFANGLDEITHQTVHFFPEGYVPKQDEFEVISQQGIVGEQAITWANNFNHISDLSIKQIACIHLYTIESPFYKELNRVMRSGTFQERQKYTDYIYYLSEALDLLPNYCGSVYRGIDCEILSKQQIGKMIVWPGFSSATLSLHLAYSFLKEKKSGTLFLIESKTGKNISKYSAEQREEEVLFGPNSRFKIISCVDEEQRKMLGFFLNEDLSLLDVYHLEEVEK